MKVLNRIMPGVMCVFMAAVLFRGCSSNYNTIKEKSPAATKSILITATNTPPFDHKTPEGTLSFWHYNDAEAPLIKAAFEKKFPKVKLNIVTFSDQYSSYSPASRLIQAIRSGSGVPDVFSAESAMIKRLIEIPDTYADITEKTKEISKDMAKYTIDIGTDSKGVVRALSHQITTGGIGYKKTVAKKYLGTDNANEIAAMLSSQDKILETAEKLKKASKGKVSLFPGWEEMKKQFLGGRSAGWVVDGKLNIDQKVLDLIGFSKKMRDNNYEAGFDTWSSGWNSAIAADEVAMCWTIPTWGIPWIIGANDKKEKENPTGKWGFCKGPFPYTWGGTWYGIYSKSQNQDIAWEFIKWWTADKEHLKEWNKQTGDIPNSMSLLSEYAADSTQVDRITGTNLYKFYSELSGQVNGSIFGQYDDTIESTFNDVMKSYLSGRISTKDDVIKLFRNKVKDNLKVITVE